MTTETPKCRCLKCGRYLDALTGANTDDAPDPGDLTLCIDCGAVMVIADDLTVRGMTEQEMDALCANTEIMNYLASQVKKIQLLPKMN